MKKSVKRITYAELAIYRRLEASAPTKIERNIGMRTDGSHSFLSTKFTAVVVTDVAVGVVTIEAL